MPSDAESAVAAFFFASRSARKRSKHEWASDKLGQAIYEMAKERMALLRLEEEAERDAWERERD